MKFIDIVKTKDFKKIKEAVESGKYDIHENYEDALIWSTENVQFEIIKYLIEQGADVNVRDDFVIKTISIDGYCEILKKIDKYNYGLFDSQKNYRYKDINWQSQFELIKLLIEKGANIHAENDRALRMAATYGHFELVKYLIEKDANIHSVIHIVLKKSTKYGHFKIVKYLVEQGVDIHLNENCTLRMAAKYGYFEIVKYLVEQGADIRVRNNNPVKGALSNGHSDIVKYLVEYGANIQVTIPYSLIKAARNGHFEIVKYLVKQCTDTQQYFDHCFAGAACGGHFDITKYLVEKGVNIYTYDNVAIKNAIHFEHFEVVKYLVEQGIDVNSEDGTLFIRTFQGVWHYEIFKYFVEQGANIRANNDYAFRYFLKYRKFDIIKYLIKQVYLNDYEILFKYNVLKQYVEVLQDAMDKVEFKVKYKDEEITFHSLELLSKISTFFKAMMQSGMLENINNCHVINIQEEWDAFKRMFCDFEFEDFDDYWQQYYHIGKYFNHNALI